LGGKKAKREKHNSEENETGSNLLKRVVGDQRSKKLR
jgi:hypothetical protein